MNRDLNNDIPYLSLEPTSEEASAQCWRQLENHLNIDFEQQIFAQLFSRRQIGFEVLEAALEIEERFAAKSKKMRPRLKTITEKTSTALLSAMVGFMSKNILGIFSQRFFTPDHEKLVIVPENINEQAAKLGVNNHHLFYWALLHETVHAAQFNIAPGLRSYLAEQIDSLYKHKKNNDNKSYKAILEQVTATMTFIEGQAEHLMDAAAEPLLSAKEVQQLRLARQEKQNHPSLLLRLLRPLRKKAQQYEQGKKFCDHISHERGPKVTLLPLQDFTLLPTMEEIKTPEIWLRRTSAITV